MKDVKKGIIDSQIDLMQDMPSGMIIIEKDGRMIEINKEMKNLLGEGVEDLKGSLIFDVIDPSDIPEILNILKIISITVQTGA